MRPAQAEAGVLPNVSVPALAESPLLSATMLPASPNHGGGQVVPATHMANAPTVVTLTTGDQVVDATQTAYVTGSDQDGDHESLDLRTTRVPILTLAALTDNGLGHCTADTPPAHAESDHAAGQAIVDAPNADAGGTGGGVQDLTVLHATLGHYARVHGDLQKTRIALSNRVAAMQRDGLADEWSAVLAAQVDALHKAERDVTAYLSKQASRHPMAPWVKAQRGIGLPGFARLIGITGSLSRFPTVSKLWRYLGLAVDDGHAPKKQRGVKLNYSPAGRVLCRQIAESIVKMGRGGEYRQVYDEKKAVYETDRPDWPPARRHAAAMRYAIKRLLRRMWIEWRRLQREGMLP